MGFDNSKLEIVVLELLQNNFYYILNNEMLYMDYSVSMCSGKYIPLNSEFLNFVKIIGLIEETNMLPEIEVVINDELPALKLTNEGFPILDMDKQEADGMSGFKYFVELNEVWQGSLAYGITPKEIKNIFDPLKGYDEFIFSVVEQNTNTRHIASFLGYVYLQYLLTPVRGDKCLRKVVNKAEFVMLFLTYPKLKKQIFELQKGKIQLLPSNNGQQLLSQIKASIILLNYAREAIEIELQLEAFIQGQRGAISNWTYFDFSSDDSQDVFCNMPFSVLYNEFVAICSEVVRKTFSSEVYPKWFRTNKKYSLREEPIESSLNLIKIIQQKLNECRFSEQYNFHDHADIAKMEDQLRVNERFLRNVADKEVALRYIGE